MTRHSTINTKRCDILYRQPGSNSTWPRRASGLFQEIDELTSLFLRPHLVYAWSRTDEADGEKLDPHPTLTCAWVYARSSAACSRSGAGD